MTRRSVLGGMAASVAAPPLARAQPVARPPRVSIYATTRTWSDAIRQTLIERGWIEGRTIAFEWYPGEDSYTQIGEHMAKAPADVIVVGGPHRIRAAMQATTSIPIVALDLESDPVANGFVKTLSRPGGYVSGVWMDQPEVAGKQHQVGGYVDRVLVLRADEVIQ